MQELLFIVNPVSGTSSKKDVEKVICDSMRSSGISFKVAYTEYAGHAGEIAQRAASEGVDVVVAVGGDGTVNEVASGIVNTDTSLAIIPAGSGNGLARHLGIPMKVSEAAKRILSSVPGTYDYGSVNGRPFFCTCGMGFDAQVSHRFSQLKKRGPASYARCVFGMWRAYKPEDYEILKNDAPEGNSEPRIEKAFLITVANASQWGNNAYIAPQASMEDGFLDMVVLHPFNAFEAMELGWELFHKTLHHSSKVCTERMASFVIRRKAPGYIHVDGEPVWEEAELAFEVHRRGIKILR